ncbi:hypothetical protein O181_024240 [Austropuccinia psidii MF-1]|uniref:Uncharacterized protein n=1 Tax=Austropuccinia psidii MF-1 TaxID=1389203 RepID=A0A9Q3GZX1_9BASI|nr:hypothetical protein [Austropuccinia psidii MF-1]
MLVMLANKHTRNAHLLSNPSGHAARAVPAQDALVRTPLWSTMMKVFPSGNGLWDPKQANGNDSRQLALSPQASICPPPLLGHHQMVTSLLNQSKGIIRPMKDGNGKRTFELGLIVTISCHPWDSKAKNKTHQIPPNKTHPFNDLSHKPSQHNEPPIFDLSSSSEPPEDVATCEPEPEVAPTKSMEEPFVCPATSCSVIIINNTPVRSPPPISPAPTLPPSTPTPVPSPDLPPIATKNPTASSPRCQAPLNPTMTLARNSPTCDQHQ